MDNDFFWHTLGGSAIISAALALAKLLLDYALRGHERRLEQSDRRRRQDHDAEARLERILQDRLAEADRRLERSDAELRAEQVRAATLEHELARLQQAYELLRVEYANLLEQQEPQRLAR
ncbi:MAG TPA: hypothetical protein VGJ60_26415 [Chloroflexota bacterium]|jgi:uncharacterized protein HemX